jgi:HEAT repeat protein
MNDERFPGDPDSSNPYALPTGNELLPPVEPPSAGFIVQLFVVPALIVIVIVGVWLTFNSLVRRTSPEKVVEGLESGPMVARWQRAKELADMLRDERYVEFKRDPNTAANVARILDKEIDSARDKSGMGEEDVTFRFFLAQALGRFEVVEGMDVLLKAATTNRDPRELLMRDGAAQAIAERIIILQQLDPPIAIENEAVESTLLRLAEDEERVLRNDAVFALGKLGTPAAIERLAVLVDDPEPDVRYNAALALAHRGNEKSVETLAEMLDPAETAALKNEVNEAGRQQKRWVIVGSALKAAEALHQKNSDADLTPLTEALTRLADADAKTLAESQLPDRVRIDSRHVLNKLKANE